MHIKTGYKVSDAMTEKPITVAPITTVKECSKIMSSKHVGSMLVIDRSALVGILTEQDIVRKVVAEGKDSGKTKVKDIMNTELITIKPDADIYDALVVMRDKNIRHLPVIFKNKLVGYVTIKDILKIEPQLFEIIAEKIELQRKGIRHDSDGGICDACGKFNEELYTIEGLLYCDNCKRKKR
ncbi:MAG: CBS domain-containing protein [Candidatus Woesearchaeota archaeon]